MMHVPEDSRMTWGELASTPQHGNNGAFIVHLDATLLLHVIASDGGGWEHVSVSRPDSTPSWDNMAAVKRLFWDPEDCVVQFHPPESEYVNNHAHCLHLWRCIDGRAFPMPPSIMVGLKGLTLSSLGGSGDAHPSVDRLA
jgi:hypothetical protein